MPNTEKILRKLDLYRKDPDTFQGLSNSELADLVVIVLAQVNTISQAIDTSKLNLDEKIGKTASDLLNKTGNDLETLKTDLINQIRTEIINGSKILSETSTELEKRVNIALQNIRNGDDGIITDAEIERAASIAYNLIELPDFDKLIGERITANPEALRDGLELLQGDARYKVEISDVQGLSETLNQLAQIRTANGGTIGKQQVYGFIRQAIADGIGGSSLPDQTGNSGKFLTTNGTDPSWATPAGSGDVVGPASATDNAIARFDGTTGKLVQDSRVTVGDEGGLITTSAIQALVTTDDTFSAGLFIKKRGTTGDSTAAVVSGTELGYHAFYGWNGSDYNRGAYVIVKSTEAYTPSAGGAYYAIATTPNGSTTASERLRVDQNGYVGIGTPSPAEKLVIENGKLVLNSNSYNTSKFNSQGVAWSTFGNNPSLIINSDPAVRPEVSWFRGARSYPEFAIRQHTTSDSGGEIYSGDGLSQPTLTMTFNKGKVGVGINPTSRLHIYENTTTTNASAGFTVEQAGTGDSVINFLLTGVRTWSMGVDNSDSDKFKISPTADVGSGPALTIDTSGYVTINTTSGVDSDDLSFHHPGAFSSSNIKYVHSIRSNNTGYWLYAYNGASYRNIYRYEWGTDKLFLDRKIAMIGLPTSATGLSTGDLWNDGGLVKVV